MFEQSHIPKRDSALHKVVGSTSENKKLVFDEARAIYNAPEESEIFAHVEVIPGEARDTLHFINDHLQPFLTQYGLVSAVDVTPDHFESADANAHERYRRGTIQGFYDDDYQKIGLRSVSWGKDRMAFAVCAVHEMIHMQSFQSVTVFEDSPDGEISHGDDLESDPPFDMKMRRNGLVIRGRDEIVYFNYLNEAIVEELTIRFVKQYASKFPNVEVDFDDWLDLEKDQSIEEDDGFAYRMPRKILNDMIDKIHRKQEIKRFSHEDIFKLFSRAALNGSLWSAARLIEDTFGKGAFREVGRINFKNDEQIM